ncbi:septal ring lytic transglycosylase RlpA family protein [Roseomonas harenae]|uniref:septal ring lytic transglycosylase RlpA family protein n=1 Tax=Muricoccus harenae TaxID=2692566 RepID=UPI001F380EB0|nr:septal ring lytic transglycosylase RlpA family protein [Roseomonas harenae]
MRNAIVPVLCLVFGMVALTVPATAKEPRPGHVAGVQQGHSHHVRAQRGRASFYSSRFHGRRMANGKRFNRRSNSAASRTLPLGTQARVRNLENGRTAVVVIQDRGPHVRSRVLDVSPETATKLGMREQGTAMVEITPLSVPRDERG